MIKASELKLGNWILPQHDLDGKYHLVKKLDWTGEELEIKELQHS